MKKFLLSRPVNSLRKIYEPAYLGAKIRAADATPFQIRILEGGIRKKLNSSEDWAYQEFTVFKGYSESGEREYRTCLSPSPSTSAAEAMLLNDLAEVQRSLRPSNVYSYCLSRPGSSTNYDYFLENYLKRNQSVGEVLKQLGDDYVAVCFDIRKFYPSIDKVLLKRKLREFELRNNNVKSIRSFIGFALHQIGEAKTGIPIGTEISHQLADIYLFDFDNAYASRFGERYFRYVDDLTIVCAKDEVESIRRDVALEMEELGLQLNDEKFEVCTFEKWLAETSNAAVDGEDFFDYCDELANWIGSVDIAIDDLARHFKDEGFNLPIEKIAARSAFKGRVNRKAITTNAVMKWTHELKEKYRIAAESMTQISSSEHSRGTLQKARRAVNPLFYLLDLSEYSLIREVAGTHKNLSVQYVVSKSLSDNNASEILDFPGSAVSSFCEISKTIGGVKNFPDFFSEPLTPYRIDAITTLALHNFADVPTDNSYHGIWHYLRKDVKGRSVGLSDFQSEIESLRINIASVTERVILEKRQDETEEINLQALDLGDQMISP
ncbi:MAG: RNA-directed DNA polymerase [Burkholderiales bacterium]|nr:RNA-directed DNA polymerase [Burkholderiales bacterium]MBH1994470.1 RNA-directed DNA polymerase [Burkholderiales bacterium]MBH2072329.1 RNA-directed DNA polymerase [Burkholderiales bacterium]